MFGNKRAPSAASSSIGFDSQGMQTVIAAQCTIEGDLHTSNSVKVDGTVKGNIRSDAQVILGEKCTVQGDVHSTDLLVFGRLEGNVHVQNLHLKPTAKIVGNIETVTLQVDSGANYQGSVTMLGSNGGAVPALAFSGDAAAPKS